MSDWSRRSFLKFVGHGSAGLCVMPFADILANSDSKSSHLDAGFSFQPIPASSADEIKLAEGMSYRILMESEQALNQKGAVFGFANDFTAFVPLRADNPQDGLLLVNHEYPENPGLARCLTGAAKTLDDVERERRHLGCSILRVRKDKNGVWTFVHGDAFNRRIDGTTPIPFSLGTEIRGSRTAVGTMANCSGGITPWSTVLSCEENTDEFWGEVDVAVEKRRSQTTTHGWNRFFDYPAEHYGWVVEVDPRSGRSKKLVGLGRFCHEGALVVLGKDKTPVVYMGDDGAGCCIYKFVGKNPGSLETGTLYVADTNSGRWIALERSQHASLQSKYSSQLEVLIHAREAAVLVGGTPQNRPEGMARHPYTGDIFVSRTGNPANIDMFGSILRIHEKKNDPLAMEFSTEVFLVGGNEAGFACPDNLCFDSRANLWITTDVSHKLSSSALFAGFKNNSLFVVPASGIHAGKPLRVATAPIDAEFTGPCFSPDGLSLFLCVQHPGEGSKSPQELTSHWPKGGKDMPRSSVIAISIRS